MIFAILDLTKDRTFTVLSPFTQTILIAFYSLPPDHFFPAFDLPPPIPKKTKTYSTPTIVTPKHLKDLHLQSQFLFQDL